jgi:hypothetical protein
MSYHAETWKSFFKIESQSGGSTVDGWLLDFYPYTKWGKAIERNPRFGWRARAGRAENNDYYSELSSPPTVHAQNIPVAQGQIPLILDGKHVKLYAGFTAAGQMPDSTVTPMIGWALLGQSD